VEISYTTPLRRAWQRMQAMLFRPFHLEKWLVLGFAAFLAELLNAGGGGFGWKNSFSSRHDSTAGAGRMLQAAREGLVALLDKPLVLLMIAVGLLMAGVLLLVLAWVGARARFVFLENVVTGRSEFVAPWHRHGRLGRSLFLWGAAFSFAWLLPFFAVLVPLLGTLESLVRNLDPVLPSFAGLGLGALAALAMVLVLGFVMFLMNHFVVPLMLMYDETATRAWARFWPLLTAHPGEFVACALFAMVVWTGTFVALAVAGVATCCIGLVLMMIPYVGTVVLLPVFVTARAFGPAFLAQYGPEWDLFAAREERVAGTGGPLPG
jgi:hypothetical protein